MTAWRDIGRVYLIAAVLWLLVFVIVEVGRG